MCAIAHLSSGESIEDMYSKCTSSNQSKPHFVYDGSTGLALLISSSLTLAPGESSGNRGFAGINLEPSGDASSAKVCK